MNDKKYLELAIKQAELSVKQSGFPAGAIVVKDGEVIAKGVSLGFLLHDPTSHAETSSIRQACNALKSVDLAGATLYASLQPCLMCFSVANWAEVSRIVYGCRKTDEMANKNYYEGKTDVGRINEENNRKIELIFISDFEERMLELVKKWESNQTPDQLLPKRYLLDALKKASEQHPELKIGHTYMTLMKYEDQGIIQKPASMMNVNQQGDWRFYTQKEIDEIVREVIEYKEQLLRQNSNKE